MGQPKALLPYRGSTFLEHILGAIEESSIDETVVVVGHHREAITARIDLRSVVYNEDYEAGMVTSLQAGIRVLPDDASGAVIFLVDHPVIGPKTIDALLSRFKPGSILLPVYGGRRGHPVLFSRAVLDEILALPATAGANTVVRRRAERVIEVEVDEPGILVDVDTPEQLESLRSDE